MTRLYPRLLFALLALVVPVESAAQNGQLAKLSEIQILVEGLDQSQKRLRLNADEIITHVLVLLRSKLPRLVVKDSTDPYVYINVNVGEDHSQG